MRILVLALAGAMATGQALDTRLQDLIPVRDSLVSIRTFQFRPTALLVPVGTRIVWTNNDGIEHTVTAGVPDSASGAFNGILAAQGATFSQTFTRTGTVAYYCNRHPFMRGEIRVTPTGER